MTQKQNIKYSFNTAIGILHFQQHYSNDKNDKNLNDAEGLLCVDPISHSFEKLTFYSAEYRCVRQRLLIAQLRS
jgi:hypothetical protein